MIPTISFGTFLAACREASGKTQAQIGSACGITSEAVCQFERGRRKPTFKLVLTLADDLHVDRGLLARFALQTRAPEFYTTLGLEPVEQPALESAYPHAVPVDVSGINPQESAVANSAQATDPLPPALGVPRESTPQPC